MLTQTEILSLLVVDDDRDDVDLLRDVLAEMKSYRATVTWASSYEQALRSDHERFDVIFLDVYLGVRSGLELLKTFVGMQIAAPIILLTGIDDPKVDFEASAAGAADFLVKGRFNAQDLERSIRYARAWGRLVDELRQKESNQRRLIDAVFDGLIVHDAAGIVLRVNESAARLLGEPGDALRGRSLQSWLPAGNLQQCAVEAGASPVFECEFVRADGTRIQLEWQCRPLWHDGDSVHLTCLRDITLRKRMHEQLLHQERLTTAGLLASSLAHEIGTPLAVMRGRAQMLQQSLAASKTVIGDPQRNLGIIVEQIDRITRLIRTLLNFMRGNVTQETRRVRVEDALQDAIELVTGELRSSGIALDVSGVSDEWVQAQADELRQIFVNLLVNAIQAIGKNVTAVDGPRSENDGRRITVKTTRVAAGMCEIAFSDTGCGIPESEWGMIFIPFFTTKEPDKGTGLGLAIVQRSVSAWGGSIDVESAEGQGTTFRVRVPVAHDVTL